MAQVSVWEKETFFAPQDVIIVGSGFVGLWGALKIAEKNPNKKLLFWKGALYPQVPVPEMQASVVSAAPQNLLTI